MDVPPRERTITISQAQAKHALALFAHLCRIFEAACRDGKPVRPVQMDHADLLLCSASFRALFFDDHPILLRFIATHRLSIEIECLETNLALLLLSWLAPDEWHVSDLLARVLLDPAMRANFGIDATHQAFLSFEDGKGFETVLQRPEIWAPSRIADENINSGLGVSNLRAPAQLVDITRRRVPLEQWGNVRIGYLKDIAINRRNLLTYVANKLGGVHYDSKRLPRDPDDANQFTVLTTSYDWDNQSIMHAGLVAVGLACIEVLSTPAIVDLLPALREFHIERQQRLIRGEKLTAPD
jgi:hypothetical protein